MRENNVIWPNWVLSRRESQFDEILVSRLKNVLVMLFLWSKYAVRTVWFGLGKKKKTYLGFEKDNGFD